MSTVHAPIFTQQLVYMWNLGIVCQKCVYWILENLSSCYIKEQLIGICLQREFKTLEHLEVCKSEIRCRAKGTGLTVGHATIKCRVHAACCEKSKSFTGSHLGALQQNMGIIWCDSGRPAGYYILLLRSFKTALNLQYVEKWPTMTICMQQMSNHGKTWATNG